MASSALLQGRTAASHIFNIPYNPTDIECIPYGIYSIPEIGMVGKTEEQLISENVSYEIGVCRFNELAKGVMQGFFLFFYFLFLFFLKLFFILILKLFYIILHFKVNLVANSNFCSIQKPRKSWESIVLVKMQLSSFILVKWPFLLI